jgi:response regulator of citrate/malate metabolism
MVTRVLIADDDPRITEIHYHYVRKFEGFEVIGLSNTLEDTKLQIEVMEPQLLLLDIYFPDGSGIELLKEIRLRSQALDIIPITAAKEVRLLQEALRGGVFDYILKPVVFSRFEQTFGAIELTILIYNPWTASNSPTLIGSFTKRNQLIHQDQILVYPRELIQ